MKFEFEWKKWFASNSITKKFSVFTIFNFRHEIFTVNKIKMKFCLSLFLVIVFAAANILNTNGQIDFQNSAAWQVENYDISVNLPTSPTERNLNAKATVTVKNVGRGAGTSVTFRLNQKAEVISAKVGGSDSTFRKSEEKLGGLIRVSVTLPGSVMKDGRATVALEYRLPVSENTGLNAIAVNGSQFLPLSTWYPTPNNPFSPRGADFAPFRLTVNANGETVVSSGKSNGTTFEQNLFGQPFFVTGSWEVVNGENNISVYLPKGANAEEKKRAEELIGLTNAATSHVSSVLGNAPDFPIKLVAVRRGAGFADGGTILLDYAAFRREKIDSTTAMTIADSIAKIWLGNVFPIRGEGFGVIREGLTRYLALLFLEKRFGAEVAEIERFRQRSAYSIVAKKDAPLALTGPLDETYFASVTNKGAMLWRLMAQIIGAEQLFGIIKANLKPEGVSLTALREAVSSGSEKAKTILNYGLDQPTDMDLLAGLPQPKAAETAVALRNTGGIAAEVNVQAITEKGEKLTVKTNIPEKNFGEAVFKTTQKIVRVEVDSDKLYPQIDFNNDFVPREPDENNEPLGEVTRAFNQQNYAKAESLARRVLKTYPAMDEMRTWLGRALLAQDKLEEADKEFKAVLASKLPTPRSLAWANIGLGEIALKRIQNAEAAKYFIQAVKVDFEYGSNLAARNGRLRAEQAGNLLPPVDEAAKTFFAQFDKTVLSGRKAEVEALILPGELTKFSSGLVGQQPETWQTKVIRTESIDASRMAVDVNLTVKVINKETESGTAVLLLTKTPNGWKLSGVELFEVR